MLNLHLTLDMVYETPLFIVVLLATFALGYSLMALLALGHGRTAVVRHLQRSLLAAMVIAFVLLAAASTTDLLMSTDYQTIGQIAAGAVFGLIVGQGTYLALQSFASDDID